MVCGAVCSFLVFFCPKENQPFFVPKRKKKNGSVFLPFFSLPQGTIWARCGAKERRRSFFLPFFAPRKGWPEDSFPSPYRFPSFSIARRPLSDSHSHHFNHGLYINIPETPASYCNSNPGMSWERHVPLAGPFRLQHQETSRPQQRKRKS